MGVPAERLGEKRKRGAAYEPCDAVLLRIGGEGRPRARGAHRRDLRDTHQRPAAEDELSFYQTSPRARRALQCTRARALSLRSVVCEETLPHRISRRPNIGTLLLKDLGKQGETTRRHTRQSPPCSLPRTVTTMPSSDSGARAAGADFLRASPRQSAPLSCQKERKQTRTTQAPVSCRANSSPSSPGPGHPKAGWPLGASQALIARALVSRSHGEASGVRRLLRSHGRVRPGCWPPGRLPCRGDGGG